MMLHLVARDIRSDSLGRGPKLKRKDVTGSVSEFSLPDNYKIRRIENNADNVTSRGVSAGVGPSNDETDNISEKSFGGASGSEPDESFQINYRDDGELTSDEESDYGDNRVVRFTDHSTSNSESENYGSDDPDDTRSYDEGDRSCMYGMFDPKKAQHAAEMKLSASQKCFVDKNFTSYIKESVIQEQVLKIDPIPSQSALTIPETDQPMLDLIGFGAKELKAVDSSLTRVQKKVINIMGPLGTCWKKLHKLRKGDNAVYDLNTVLPLIEKSVLLVGQVHVTLSFQRRLNVLARVLGDSKKAMDLLRTHDNKLSKDTNLFGADFFKSLAKKAKSDKDGANIRQELGTKRRFKPKFKKPFRQGAQRGGFREGHKSVSGYQGFKPTSHMSRGGFNNNSR